MGGHPFPEIPCTICAKPVDLVVDLYADEYGHAMHEACYVMRVTNVKNQRAAEKLLNTLSTEQSIVLCPFCRSPLLHLGATFKLQSGKAWMIPLPVCGYCLAAGPAHPRLDA
jgi:hypothetical protein